VGIKITTAIINYIIRHKAEVPLKVRNFGPRQILLLLVVSLLAAAVAYSSPSGASTPSAAPERKNAPKTGSIAPPYFCPFRKLSRCLLSILLYLMAES
jgi:hypothetical protein